jgi:proline iminopeptidase
MTSQEQTSGAVPPYAVGPPARHGWLPLDGLHAMYYEESGSPGGIPVVYVHGGPGAGLEPEMRAVHDPEAFRLVMYDQRGAGKSTPAGEIRDNTIAHLVDDLDRLRAHLGIERWIVSGGSWGTTVALAYAQRHADRCLALVLRGIFLGEDSDVRWFENGVRTFYPDVWAATIAGLEPDASGDFLAPLRQQILDPDPAIAGPAAVKMARYEWLACSVDPDVDAIDDQLTAEYCLPYQRIGAHYREHLFFLEPGQLLREIPAMRHVPGFIVNGRLDMICPPTTAYRLSEAWPEAELHLVPMAGHFATEPGIAGALLSVMERLKRQPAEPPLPGG